MQLHFESDLDYQLEAIEAVCGLFRGQEACRAEFSVTAQAARRRASPQISLGMAESGLGVGNRLTLDAHTRSTSGAISITASPARTIRSGR